MAGSVDGFDSGHTAWAIYRLREDPLPDFTAGAASLCDDGVVSPAVGLSRVETFTLR